MNFDFKQLHKDSNSFFEILPKDWQEEIIPFWTHYEDSSKIFIIEENNTVIGGGIIFSTTPPDIIYFKEEAQLWFDDDYLYIGFLWIAEDKRNNNLGSLWLEELKNLNPDQKYWLLIEDERLHGFYQRNGFKLIKTIINDQHSEWLYSFVPVSC